MEEGEREVRVGRRRTGRSEQNSKEGTFAGISSCLSNSIFTLQPTIQLIPELSTPTELKLPTVSSSIIHDMAHNAIHLGIELEFIVFGKNVTRNWNETAEKMAQTLTAAGVETEVREIMEGIPPRWVITTDASISKVKFANHPAGIRPDERTSRNPPARNHLKHTLIPPAEQME